MVHKCIRLLPIEYKKVAKTLEGLPWMAQFILFSNCLLITPQFIWSSLVWQIEVQQNYDRYKWGCTYRVGNTSIRALDWAPKCQAQNAREWRLISSCSMLNLQWYSFGNWPQKDSHKESCSWYLCAELRESDTDCWASTFALDPFLECAIFLRTIVGQQIAVNKNYLHFIEWTDERWPFGKEHRRELVVNVLRRNVNLA